MLELKNMQNYTNYIIGLLILCAIGFLIYAIYLPSKDKKDTYEQKVENNLVATNTQEVKEKQTQNMQENKKEMYTVKMETNKGVINLELNSKIAPKTVENFIKLTNSGFYNGVKFHRVIKDFMIQSGDPQSKDDKLMGMWGTGGPGYKFDDEITDPATYKAGYKRGILAMANSGPNTNGSQFFIMHKDVPLSPDYTIFGKIKDGDEASFETLDTIANVKTVPGDRPVENVVITKVSIE